jgi:hypothetical protein
MFEEIKEMIDSTIYTNGRGEVTAQNINLAMHGVVEATEEEIGKVNDAVKTVEDKVSALEENGTGGNVAPSGPLRVWINEIIGTENTPEQIAENVATYNVLARRETPIIQLIAVLDEGDLYTNGVFIPDQYSLMVSTKGNIIVEISAKLVEDSAYITLREDGSVTFEGDVN